MQQVNFVSLLHSLKAKKKKIVLITKVILSFNISDNEVSHGWLTVEEI